MSLEKAHERALLWLRQAEDDWVAAQVLQQAGQATQACFLAQQVGETVIKALLAHEDRDLRSHGQREARLLGWVRTTLVGSR